jgi:hypothetical protein
MGSLPTPIPHLALNIFLSLLQDVTDPIPGPSEIVTTDTSPIEPQRRDERPNVLKIIAAKSSHPWLRLHSTTSDLLGQLFHALFDIARPI